MRTQLLLFIGILFFVYESSAQSDSKSDFIYLFSGTVIEGEKIIFDRDEITVNSKTISYSEVQFFQEAGILYANTNPLSGSPTFAERISGDKLNLFEYTTQSYSLRKDSYGNLRKESGMVWRHRYYNTGFNNIKLASYKNLLPEMADNPAALKLLKRFRTHKILNSVTILSGIGLCITGAIIIGSDGSKPSDEATQVLIYSGAVLLGSSIYFTHSYPKKMHKAFEVYNQ